MSDINIGAITEALNDKADRDAGNFGSTGKKRIIGFGIPDYNAGISISSWPYTIPSVGWVKAEIHAQNGQYGKRLLYTPPDASTVYFGNGELASGNYANSQSVMFIVEEGGTIDRESTAISAVFYPMKGISV